MRHEASERGAKAMTDDSGDAWLSLDEAAERLAVSRLRLREAIAANALAARRDNRGFWRISLAEGADVAMRRIGETRADPQQLVELLFDEIEDLNALMGERAANEERMAALIERQQALLDRALSLAELPTETGLDAERVAALNDRSQQLIEQTLGKIEARDAELSKLTGLMDRALTTVVGLDAEVTRQAEVAVKQRALLERVFQLAEQSLDRIVTRESGLGLFRRLRDRMAARRPGRANR
jgi:excisionase family DNA binding protein